MEPPLVSGCRQRGTTKRCCREARDRVGAFKRSWIKTNGISYAKRAIHKAPQNQSPWNYLKGIIRQAKLPLATLKEFASEFADIRRPDNIYSSHALDLLADIYSEEEAGKEEAKKALDLLATKYDPIRAHYWNYRKSLLESEAAA